MIEKFNLLSSTDVPTALEYFSNLKVYYELKKIDEEVDFKTCCRTSLDYQFKPIRFATGGGADGVFKLKYFNVIVEATTIENETSLMKNEIEPVIRHAWDLWKQTEKQTIVAFFAPKLFTNFEITILNNFIFTPISINDNDCINPSEKITITLNEIEKSYSPLNYNFSEISEKNKSRYNLITSNSIK